jgi:hypothetical protein
MLYAANTLNDIIEKENISNKLNMSVNDYTLRKRELLNKYYDDNGIDDIVSSNDKKILPKIEMNNFFIPQEKKLNDILSIIQTFKLKKNITNEDTLLKKYLQKESTSFPSKLCAIKDNFIRDLETSLSKRKLNLNISSHI